MSQHSPTTRTQTYVYMPLEKQDMLKHSGKLNCQGQGDTHTYVRTFSSNTQPTIITHSLVNLADLHVLQAHAWVSLKQTSWQWCPCSHHQNGHLVKSPKGVSRKHTNAAQQWCCGICPLESSTCVSQPLQMKEWHSRGMHLHVHAHTHTVSKLATQFGMCTAKLSMQADIR